MSDMFNRFGGTQGNQQIQNGPDKMAILKQRIANMNNFAGEFNNFRRGINGNPDALLIQCLQSGVMDQETYQGLSDLAKKLIGKA